MTPTLSPVVAVCVGHSRFIAGRPEGGALTCAPVTSEWDFNDPLARLIAAILHDTYGVAALVVNRYAGSGYAASMRWLADTLREAQAALAVELHFNSADTPAAGGHEWLHWHSSSRGLGLARALETSMSIAFPAMRRRGVKAIGPRDRGAAFLNLTHCPAAICEPFFGSSPEDCAAVRGRPEHLAAAIATALAAVAKNL